MADEAVFVASLGLIGSMGFIVVGATVAGLLCYVLEKKADRAEHH